MLTGDLDELMTKRTLLPMTATAKLITKGSAQVISLPKAFRFPGKTVRLQRTAKGVLISTDKPDVTKLRKVLSELAGSCPDFPDILRPPGRDIPRDLDW